MSLQAALLNRRPNSFYVGKVLYVTGQAVPVGCVEGYYLVTADDGNGGWVLHFCGFDMPPGEPVYVHDGVSWDLKAIPSTVFPSIGTWALWFGIWAAIALAGVEFTYEHNWWLGILCIPVALVPAWEWFYEVEPVRATKVAWVMFAIFALLAAKRHRDKRQYREWAERSKFTVDG